MKNIAISILFIAFVCPFFSLQAQDLPTWYEPVQQRIDYYTEQPENFGIAVGIIERGKIYDLYDGEISRSQAQAPDSTTVFELGSLAKIFTAHTFLLLESQAKVNLQAPITQYLNLPFENEYLAQISLQQLLSHTSGLPKTPFNLKFTSNNAQQPWQNYQNTDLLEYLKTYKPKKLWSEGKNFEYSDLGYAILGLILEQMNFDEQNINTQQANISGHNSRGIPAENWTYPNYLQYAINQSSSLPNLLAYVNNLMQAKETIFRNKLLKPQAKTNNKKVKIATAWHLINARKMGWNVYTHSGSSGGFRSFVVFNPKLNVGVVILANTDTKLIDNLGIQILDLLAK